MTARHFEFSRAGLVIVAMLLDGELIAGSSSSFASGQVGKLSDSLRRRRALPAGWRELSSAELAALECAP